MTNTSMFDGFEAFRIPKRDEVDAALQGGILALDANVLLNLYRYTATSVDDLLKVFEAAKDRLFLPNQVVREFWRNRQVVIGSLGNATRDLQQSLDKSQRSISEQLATWARSVALGADEHEQINARVTEVFDTLRGSVGEAPERISAHLPTDEDELLARLTSLFDGRVGPALSDDGWVAAVAEGERRVQERIPPGYMDADKLESDLPEGASGDYLVWHQLLIEGERLKKDLVLVTADTKEDWWNRAERGSRVGPRYELVSEYFEKTGHRLHLLEPAQLLEHAETIGITALDSNSVDDVRRVQDEATSHVAWTTDAVEAVLARLENASYVQAQVIREASRNGGRISRDRVYDLDGRDAAQSLRGFTKPVLRMAAEVAQSTGLVVGSTPLLGAVYETGVKLSHLSVPHDAVDALRAQ